MTYLLRSSRHSFYGAYHIFYTFIFSLTRLEGPKTAIHRVMNKTDRISIVPLLSFFWLVSFWCTHCRGPSAISRVFAPCRLNANFLIRYRLNGGSEISIKQPRWVTLNGRPLHSNLGDSYAAWKGQKKSHTRVMPPTLYPSVCAHGIAMCMLLLRRVFGPGSTCKL